MTSSRRLAIVVGFVLVAGIAGVVVRWVWLPHYRPGLEPGESYGVDVSNHQGRIDWEAVADDHIEFAYIKATEGGDFVDAGFVANWQGAKAAGLDVGLYHFFTLCRPGAEQVANFLDTAPVLEADLPASLDLELNGNCAARPSVEWVQREVGVFVDEVERITGEKVLFYVGPDFDDLYDITGTFAGPLWERRILRRPGGSRWTVWQLTYFSEVDGIEGGVDLDVMRSAG